MMRFIRKLLGKPTKIQEKQELNDEKLRQIIELSDQIKENAKYCLNKEMARNKQVTKKLSKRIDRNHFTVFFTHFEKAK